MGIPHVGWENGNVEKSLNRLGNDRQGLRAQQMKAVRRTLLLVAVVVTLVASRFSRSNLNLELSRRAPSDHD